MADRKYRKVVWIGSIQRNLKEKYTLPTVIHLSAFVLSVYQ